MPLAAGSRFGDYEIIGTLGSGGMGHVFKARDTRLGRTVALKILSPQLTADSQAVARLVREAQTLASVGHPHVCALFQLAQHEDRSVLVMEYLEGTTLADRLARGRLPVGQSLRIGIEIADGLAAAHRAGVVHRDLKPENIMLTTAGAKLLDFGLARPHVPVFDGRIAETASRHALTAAGTIVGTFPYMAPEQMEGGALDARTDIWAFGCVLYEMVTGRRTFDGATPANLIAAILDREPPPAASLEPAASGALDRVIRKCLSKDPDARWQSALDLRDELRWIADRGDGPAAALASTTSMRSGWLMSATAGAALAAALLVLMWPPWRVQHADREVSRLEMTIPSLSMPDSLTLSPDGRHLAFIAANAEGRRVVWVRTLAESAPRPIAGTEDATPGSPPIWSPDATWIAFVSGGKLRKVGIAGGAVVTLADVSGEVLGGSWNAGETIVVGTRQASPTHGVHSVRATGGRLVPHVPLEPGAYLHGMPKFLPDGRRFVYGTWAFDESRREVCLASLDNPSGRCLGIKAHYVGDITRDGYLVYARAGTLFAQRFDLDAGRPAGEPVIMAEGLSQDPFGRTSMSVAAEGTLVYQTAPPQLRQFVWVGRDGRIISTSGEPGAYGGFDASPRGDAIIAEAPIDPVTGRPTAESPRPGRRQSPGPAVCGVRPESVMGRDTTELVIGGSQKLYLATVWDLLSRFIVGWAVSAVNDRHLTIKGREMALTRHGPQIGLLHHSDQGCNTPAKIIRTCSRHTASRAV
jgi:serine/threonine-protein kinase